MSKNRQCLGCDTSKNAPWVVYKPKDDKHDNEESLSHHNICYSCVFQVHDDLNENDSEYQNFITYKEKTEFNISNELSKFLIKNRFFVLTPSLGESMAPPNISLEDFQETIIHESGSIKTTNNLLFNNVLNNKNTLSSFEINPTTKIFDKLKFFKKNITLVA